MEKKIEPIYPNSQFKTFCYIKSVITRPNIIVGDYSYYDDSEEGGADDYASSRPWGLDNDGY